jgi:ankyrin repeat protein
MLHYACYFGKVKTIKAICEEYKADPLAKDYRGQTPLHVATSSGELGAMLYLISILDGSDIEYKEIKDNALMTPLMNTIVENNVPSFCYLLFKQKCSLNHIDI